jgi:hypothetical protein
MIALLSVPNTGTWFTLELLKLSPQIEHVVDYNRGFWGLFRKEYTREILKYDEVPDLHSVIYRRHILGNKSHGDIDLICTGHNSVIPFRDPLASLISRRNRNPLQPQYEHIDALEYVATSPHILSSFIFPIDTDEFKTNWVHRVNLAECLYTFCGLDKIEFGVWAKENEKKNAMPEYPEQEAYLNGDIKAATKKCYGEYLYLKSKEKTIRPFMEHVGYKSAIWWD